MGPPAAMRSWPHAGPSSPNRTLLARLARSAPRIPSGREAPPRDPASHPYKARWAFGNTTWVWRVFQHLILILHFPFLMSVCSLIYWCQNTNTPQSLLANINSLVFQHIILLIWLTCYFCFVLCHVDLGVWLYQGGGVQAEQSETRQRSSSSGRAGGGWGSNWKGNRSYPKDLLYIRAQRMLQGETRLCIISLPTGESVCLAVNLTLCSTTEYIAFKKACI